MMAKRTLSTLIALALVSAYPAVSEASFAKKIGSRYGGTLSSNTSTRTQQLTADPVTTLRGSTSTEYDPSVVSLDNIFAEEGFFVTEAYVGMTYDEGETEALISLGAFIESGHLEGRETGYLQVFYASASGEVLFSAAVSSLEEGYTVVDTDGEIEGDNTHTMLFNYIAENDSTLAKYRLYADDGSRGATADSLVSTEDPTFIIRDIAEANVAGSLIPPPGTLIPLPAAVIPGMIGLAGVAFVKKFRRKLIA
jgi:hypothetical protein